MKLKWKMMLYSLFAVIVLAGGTALSAGPAQAASTKQAFIAQIEKQYQDLEEKFTNLYKADLKKTTEDYEEFLEKASSEQRTLEKILDADLAYLEELFKADYEQLNAKYGSQKSYQDGLLEYKREINPNYSTGALWKYNKESDKHYSTSLHWNYNNQINPNYSTSYMWKYKNETNPNYSTGTMWEYKNTVNPSYSTSLMWGLHNESNVNYSTSTMWEYKIGDLTQAETQKKMDKILTDGDTDLQEARDKTMTSIEKLRKSTVETLADLRDETVRKLLEQRDRSVKEISSLREKHFGSGIEVKALQISFDKIKVIIDGELQKFEQPPVAIKNTTLVPMRAIFERLGAEISWNAQEQSVTATRGETTIYLKNGDTQATVDGKPITLKVPGQTVNGRMMVPIRFISESLGADVKWEEETQTVFITTK